MKTVLMTFSFLYGTDDHGIPRLHRVQNFLRYYTNLKEKGYLKFDKIILQDNGGTDYQIDTLKYEFPNLEVIKFPFLRRGRGMDCLPCWRCIYQYKVGIEQGFDKLLILDDDAYLLSKKLIDHINAIESGWETLWCPKYQFPESSVSILCRDAFPLYEGFTPGAFWERNNTGWAELMFPYTKVNKEFNCDRWGETRVPQDASMDGYFQTPGDMILTPVGFESYK